MCKELTPWRFIVNCLYHANRPLKLDSEFWGYTSEVSGKLQAKIDDVEIYDDHYSIENIIAYNPLLIIVDLKKQTIRLDDRVNEKYLNDFVNCSLDKNIKKRLPRLIEGVFNKKYKYCGAI